MAHAVLISILLLISHTAIAGDSATYVRPQPVPPRPSGESDEECLSRLARTSIARPSPYFQPHSGTEIAPIPGWDLPSGSTIHLLSDGVKDRSQPSNYGRVYLVISPEGERYVLKVYSSVAHKSSDQESLEFLRKVVQKQSHPDSFRIAAPSSTEDPKTMRLSYALGRDLLHLLTDPKTPGWLRERLSRDYERRLSRLLADIKSASTRTEGEIVTRYFHGLDDARTCNLKVYEKGGMNPDFDLNITPAQVIVDPVTLDMTIIDPK